MDTIKVSIIVPCYGVETYLKKCIGTLARQSLREIEIIAVNDASPDGTQRVLEEMKEQVGEKLRIFQKEHGGLSHTRNFGLEQARGEYVAFLDGDDYVDLDLYQRLYEKALETHADAVSCPVRYEWANGKNFTVSGHVPPLCEGNDLKDTFTRFYPAVWNKLYKREVLMESGVRFKCGAWFEDVEFSHRLFPYFRRIASIDTAVIHYVQREGSVTWKADERLFDYIGNFETIISFFKEQNLFEAWEKPLEYATVRYLLASFLKRAAHFSDDDFKRALSDALGLLEKEFPRWRHNPYLYKNGAKGLYLRFFSPKLAYLMRKWETR